MKKGLCFLSGMLLSAVVLICAVLLPAVSTARFEAALVSTVNQRALGMSESDLSAFAEETIRYLRGQQDTWQPDVPFPVADAFREHMADVRGWVSAAPWVIGAGALVGWLLHRLGGCRRKPALWGMGVTAALVTGVLLWAAVDFQSLWRVLHQAFIPNGIFAYDEPVMQLFPLALFFRYIVPVAVSAAGHLAVLFFYFWKSERQI